MKNQSSTKILVVVLMASCWLAQQAWPQAAAQNPAPQPQATTSNTQNGANAAAPDKDKSANQASPATPSNQASGAVDQGSAQPVTTYPDASGAEQKTQPAQTSSLPSAPQPKSQPAEPQGAATAEKVSTAGGAAAKPAGVAIAPAKQHRTRSLLIKVGAVAAVGVAAGTVYALSRGTPSVPPGSNSSIAVPK